MRCLSCLRCAERHFDTRRSYVDVLLEVRIEYK